MARSHLGRRLHDGVEQTTNATGLVTDGAEREREERFLEVAMAVEEHPLILKVGSLTRERPLEGFPNDRPCRGPAFAEVLAHGERMLSAADRPVAVVVNLHMPGTPDERDGEVGGQAETDGCAETLRPRLNGTERRLAPVPRTHDLAHLTATDEPIFGARLCASILKGGIGHGHLRFQSSARGRHVLVERHKNEGETGWQLRHVPHGADAACAAGANSPLLSYRSECVETLGWLAVQHDDDARFRRRRVRGRLRLLDHLSQWLKI